MKGNAYPVLADIRATALTKLSRDTVILLERLWRALHVLEPVEGDLDNTLDRPSAMVSQLQPTFVVRPKLVPKARRQLRQWQSDVRAASGESRVKLYRSLPQTHLPI